MNDKSIPIKMDSINNWNDVCAIAKQKMTMCRVCKECNGIICAGETPGAGGKANGSTFIKNVKDLKKVSLKMNVIVDNDEVSTESELFGWKVALPVYPAPIGGIERNYGCKVSESEYTRALIEGCGDRSVVFTGDGVDVNSFIDPINEYHNRRGIPTVKPWKEDMMVSRIDILKEAGCRVCCSDIDAAGLSNLRDNKAPVEYKNVEAISKMKQLLDMPLIIKGIMTKEAALKALEAGADGIVVSNHGGRVMQDGTSTIEVLEEIAQAVDGRMTILIDGGFRSGYDVFKAIALGADGVLIGRPFSVAAMAGSEGVRIYLNKIENELREAMQMCGCKTIQDIKRTCVKVTLEKETI